MGSTSHMSLALFCILLSLILGIAGNNKGVSHKHCLQWCVTDDYEKCSELLNCEVHYHDVIPGDHGKPQPVASHLKVLSKCFQHENNTYNNIGLEISWDINGQYISDGSVEGFYLEIQDVDGYSTESILYIRILPNTTMKFNENYIHFEYFYVGLDKTNAPVISENTKYTVTLESLPMYFEQKPPVGRTTPQEIIEELKIPENFRRANNCTSPEQPVEEKATLVSATVEPEKSDDMLTMVVTTSVIFVILLIVVIVGIVSFKFRKEKAVQSTPRAQNILVLLNVGDRTEIGKQTNWMATALGRAKNLGPLTVKYNKWETKLVAEKGITEWMRESVAWTDKIIISSTPDQLRVEENALAFERAFEHTMSTSVILEDKTCTPVFVVHFKEEEYHSKCPFLKDERYKKFHLEEDWQDLCRGITDTISGEKEPFQNGSRQNSETKFMSTVSDTTRKFRQQV